MIRFAKPSMIVYRPGGTDRTRHEETAVGQFTKRYPDSWSVQKVADFMADCYRVGRIPKGAKVKSRKRGDMIEVTWTWKADQR